jgi:RHS repeat-associated protein
VTLAATGSATPTNVSTRARVHHTGVGRWLTEDPLLGNLGDPMSFNRYVYVNGNPVDYSDPSGLATYYRNERCHPDNTDDAAPGMFKWGLRNGALLLGGGVTAVITDNLPGKRRRDRILRGLLAMFVGKQVEEIAEVAQNHIYCGMVNVLLSLDDANRYQSYLYEDAPEYVQKYRYWGGGAL